MNQQPLNQSSADKEPVAVHVLVIEDNPGDARYVQELLRDMRFTTVQMQWAQTLREGIEMSYSRVDVVLLDLHLPDSEGLSTLRRFYREAGRHAAVLILSGLDDEELAVQAVREGAQDYLPKTGIDGAVLQRALRYALDRHRIEEQLREFSAELERYSSHLAGHLRAPLRRVLGFAGMLLEEPTMAIDDRNAWLARIVDCCESMRMMIEHLDELNRLLGNHLSRSAVDVSLLATVIGEELRAQHPDHPVLLVVQPKLLARADPRLVRIALEQLMSNAWKFTRLTSKAQVEVGCSAEDTQLFQVKDNGIGFDQTQARLLFLPFVRLHSEPKFEGNGIGLAMVKRVVTRHGGRCFATGTVGAGACFSFSLGDNEPSLGDGGTTNLPDRPA